MKKVHFRPEFSLLYLDHPCQIQLRRELQLLLAAYADLRHTRFTSGIIRTVPSSSSLSTLPVLLVIACAINWLKTPIHQCSTRSFCGLLEALARLCDGRCRWWDSQRYFSIAISGFARQPTWADFYFWKSLGYICADLFGQELDQALGWFMTFLRLGIVNEVLMLAEVDVCLLRDSR